MMTAEEHFKKWDDSTEGIFDYHLCMIEFAKLHVEQALKEAVKNAKFNMTKYKIQVVEDSIKNAYPLNKIK
jgi:ribosomal protein S7